MKNSTEVSEDEVRKISQKIEQRENRKIREKTEISPVSGTST